MRGIRFDEYDTFNDFGLILSSKTIGSADIKVETVDIPAGDGEIDYTEYFGEPHYNNRQLSFDFSTVVHPSEFLNLFSTVQNSLHGRKMRIFVDNDNDFYYFGRVNVNEWKSNGRIGKLTIDADCDPWKYHSKETIRRETVSERDTILLMNDRKSVAPTITTTGNITIKFDDVVYVLSSGTRYKFSQLKLREGRNTIEVLEGNGEITFTYQEARL